MRLYYIQYFKCALSLVRLSQQKSIKDHTCSTLMIQSVFINRITCLYGYSRIYKKKIKEISRTSPYNSCIQILLFECLYTRTILEKNRSLSQA